MKWLRRNFYLLVYVLPISLTIPLLFFQYFTGNFFEDVSPWWFCLIFTPLLFRLILTFSRCQTCGKLLNIKSGEVEDITNTICVHCGQEQ